MYDLCTQLENLDLHKMLKFTNCSYFSSTNHAYFPTHRFHFCFGVLCAPDRHSMTNKTFINRNGDNQSLPIIGKCECRR